MEEPTCKDCKHFRQHYVYFLDTEFRSVPCGHCVFPRLKHRKTDTPACCHFLPKDEKPPEA